MARRRTQAARRYDRDVPHGVRPILALAAALLLSGVVGPGAATSEQAQAQARARLQLPYRECRNVGPAESDVALFNIVTRKVICGRARTILRRWYHDPSQKDTGPAGWRCAQFRRSRFELRSYCHRSGRLIAFSQSFARR
jgi:hypothetical protein